MTRSRKQTLSTVFAVISVILAGLTTAWAAKRWNTTPYSVEPTPTGHAQLEAQWVASHHKIARHSTAFDSLVNAGLSPQEVQEIVSASRQTDRNLAKIRAGTSYAVFRSPSSDAQMVQFEFSPVESLKILKEQSGTATSWKAEVITKTVERKTRSFVGVVQSSLWDSAISMGMDTDLIIKLSEVFAWQVDFSREVQPGDSWRFTVEELLVDGQRLGWGEIRVAEYQNAGQVYTALLHETEDGKKGYYFPDGTSLQRMFLRSPIQFGRITSRFQMRRFHPILRVRRPHLGVDYGAPTGTPVRAVGDGVVVFAQRRGGGGKTIKLRHNSTYSTLYKHLNGYAKGIRPGSRVRQGQTIGFVGSSGLSTGPHLHFEFWQNGKFINPLSRQFPSGTPVPVAHLDDFKRQVPRILALLPAWTRESLPEAEAAQLALQQQRAQEAAQTN